MKIIIYIIFILIIISSCKNGTTNNESNEVKSLAKDLLAYNSGTTNKFKNTVWKEHLNDIFNGVWLNEDEKTDFITRCNIRYDNNKFYIQMWGACHPSDCDWGERATEEVEKGTYKFDLLWDQGFVDRTLTYEIIDGNLKLTVKSHFKDNSGRPDFTLIGYFIKR